MTVMTILLSVIIAILYLVLGLLIFIIIFIYDNSFDETLFNKQRYIRGSLALTISLWPLALIMMITRFNTTRFNTIDE